MLIYKFLDFIYPNVCGICGKKINYNTYTCLNCLSILKYYKERIITSPNENFDFMINLFEYKGIIKDRICKFKFQNDKYIARTFADLIIKKLQKLNIKFDIIIPVPISKKRYFERGYNQSYEMSKYISLFFKKSVCSNSLIKIKDNKRQSSLNLEDRKLNVLGVYKLKKNNLIKNKTILLIDDVYTTGATVNECCKILKQNGASKIIVVTVAY